jgi:multiple antibiotic resistance protein
MIETDIRNFLTALLLVVGGLLPIVNPVGSAPLFLTMTHGATEEMRAELALKVAINSFLLIMGSLIVGGAVLCALGWNMLSSEPPPPVPNQPPVASDMVIARAFYPLTLPLTVDPGAISVAVTLGANHAHGIERVVIGLVAGVIGTAIIALCVWIAYRYAERIARWLGHTRVMVVLRLSAFIVLCIGVEITWNGIHALAAELSFAPPGAAAPASAPATP